MSDEHHRRTGQRTPRDDAALGELDEDQDQSSTGRKKTRALGRARAGANMPKRSQPATGETVPRPVSRLPVDRIVLVAGAASFSCPEIRAPGRGERLVPVMPRDGWGLRAGIVAAALIAALGLGWFGGTRADKRDEVQATPGTW